MGPIPAEGEIESTGRVANIFDKGSAAVLEFESTSIDTATGKPLLKTSMSLFCRGEGGFGGDRGASTSIEFPARAADHEVSYATREDQALTYRLSGDTQPAALRPLVRCHGRF